MMMEQENETRLNGRRYMGYYRRRIPKGAMTLTLDHVLDEHATLSHVLVYLELFIVRSCDGEGVRRRTRKWMRNGEER